MKKRLDQALVQIGLVSTRSQAENYIRLGKVTLNKKVVTKPGTMVGEEDKIRLIAKEQYVSRAGLKLASVAKALDLDFKDKVVLDVGSSTGGFTDYALQHGAKKVIAVDVGTNQLHPSLRGNPKIELYEKTNVLDVRVSNFEFRRGQGARNSKIEIPKSNLALADVSFVSLRELLPHIAGLIKADGEIIAMVKPQFEAGDQFKHKGVIKNDRVRRKILQDFEQWVRELFVIKAKADSDVSGAKGNRERFYLLTKVDNK